MVMQRRHLTCAGIAFALYLHHLVSTIEVPLDCKLWFTPLRTPAEEVDMDPAQVLFLPQLFFTGACLGLFFLL